MTQTKTMTARFKGLYRFRPEGRQWEVASESGNVYTVTIWQDAELGRLALCSCKAAEFGQACKHIRYTARVDSILTLAPVREILPVAA